MTLYPNDAQQSRYEFDRADRIRRAMRVADLGVQELADYLDVSRNTVSTWINGRIQPSTQSLRLIALRTGFSFTWLRDGKLPTNGGESKLPDPESNQELDRLNTVETRLVVPRNRQAA